MVETYFAQQESMNHKMIFTDCYDWLAKSFVIDAVPLMQDLSTSSINWMWPQHTLLRSDLTDFQFVLVIVAR